MSEDEAFFNELALLKNHFLSILASEYDEIQVQILKDIWQTSTPW